MKTKKSVIMVSMSENREKCPFVADKNKNKTDTDVSCSVKSLHSCGPQLNPVHIQIQFQQPKTSQGIFTDTAGTCYQISQQRISKLAVNAKLKISRVPECVEREKGHYCFDNVLVVCLMLT